MLKLNLLKILHRYCKLNHNKRNKTEETKIYTKLKTLTEKKKIVFQLIFLF